MEIDIYGANGHAKVIIEIIEELDYEVSNIYDDDLSISTTLDYSVNSVYNSSTNLFIAIGNNLVRREFVRKFNISTYPILIHPKAVISKRATIKEGTVIMTGVSVNSEVKIGKHCIINTNASIDHDCIIDDFAHISPNVALAGNVEVGEGTHVGIGACVIQGVRIGKWCTIGAGAVVIKDIPDGATVVGNPGRIIKIKDINE